MEFNTVKNIDQLINIALRTFGTIMGFLMAIGVLNFFSNDKLYAALMSTEPTLFQIGAVVYFIHYLHR